MPETFLREAAQAELSKLFARNPAMLPNLQSYQGYKIVLYGAGNLGRLGADFLQNAGIKPAYVLDRNPQASLGDIPVHLPDAIKADEQACVLVATVNAAFSPIAQELKEAGWPVVLPFYDFAAALDAQHPLHNGWVSGPLDEQDRLNIAQVMEGWEDDVSRAAYLQFLFWRYVREDYITPLAPVDLSNRFFIPEVTAALRSDEVVVDAGAYHGEVLNQFVQQAGGIKSAHLFEPDVENFALLKEKIAALSTEIELYPNALFEQGGEYPFSQGFGLCSAIREEGESSVQAIALDKLALKPSFIKLHLEGAELAALKGAQKTIADCRPIVVATIYHNRDGIWKTPYWLMQHLTDYRFYCRMHSWCGTGVVIYAIAKERDV